MITTSFDYTSIIEGAKETIKNCKEIQMNTKTIV